ncbi:hypothetical protein AMATHDRAFT_140990 [Amanita thiersii Skay4041]|uniref:RPEL repeat protein n=1 Tax=Amanita thiersii Skay4041 TaxID=703135 RepID=A0A2A9NUM5_9AGAR|nr:hypothetical protein AMATHDRAFT_140990 [Amanita thiersii Skay4041]
MDAENKLKRRQSTLDEATVQKLEKQINERPDKQELIDRNILKDDKGVAPSLIATREKLERSRLQDKLDQALQHRPNQNELIEQGILNGLRTYLRPYQF